MENTRFKPRGFTKTNTNPNHLQNVQRKITNIKNLKNIQSHLPFDKKRIHTCACKHSKPFTKTHTCENHEIQFLLEVIIQT